MAVKLPFGNDRLQRLYSTLMERASRSAITSGWRIWVLVFVAGHEPAVTENGTDVADDLLVERYVLNILALRAQGRRCGDRRSLPVGQGFFSGRLDQAVRAFMLELLDWGVKERLAVGLIVIPQSPIETKLVMLGASNEPEPSSQWREIARMVEADDG